MKIMKRTKENYIAFKTILWRETRRFVRLWIQTILPPAITTTLYYIIFGNLIGPRIGSMHGYEYIQFIAPGLIMMAIITSTYANVTSSFYMAKFQRSIEELLISPMPNYLILSGYLSGGIIRGIGVGLVVSIITILFTHLSVAHIFITFLVVLLSALLFALAGFINGVFARNFDDIAIIPTFVITPLTYLGGVFYSVSMLPHFWQKVSLANPILYMISAFRFGILGISDINVYFALLMLALCDVLLYGFCLYLLNKGTGIRT